MWPLLFSGNDQVRNRKCGNYAGDKSRMHLPNPSRNSMYRGYAAQIATQFMQSKTQQMHCRAVAAAIAFNCTRSHSMKTTLLLTDEAETTRLMLKDVAFDELPVRDTEAHAGCNCDRWGHPR